MIFIEDSYFYDLLCNCSTKSLTKMSVDQCNVEDVEIDRTNWKIKDT